MLFSSANFEESRVTYGSDDSGDLSLRDACLGKRRSTNKRSYIPSNVDFKCKGDIGKGMTGGHKEGTQKKKKIYIYIYIYIASPLWCIDGHPPPPKVGVHPGECSQEQSQVRVHSSERSQEQSQVWKLRQFLNWYNHWRSGWRLSLMKSCEHHHWIFRNVWNEFW